MPLFVAIHFEKGFSSSSAFSNRVLSSAVCPKDRITYYDFRMAETINGVPVTEAQIEASAAEVESGYDVAELKRRGRGRPGRGAEPSQVVAVRLTNDELAQIDAHAAVARTTRSEVIRDAVMSSIARKREDAGVASAIPLDLDAIARACQQFGVRRLRIFGSALTDRFDPSTSDVDFLVDFLPGRGDYFHDYFDLKTELERIFGRDVDLVDAGAVRNPYFAKSAFSSAQDVYAA
jgi:predicted nucleotidyltransferase